MDKKAVKLFEKELMADIREIISGLGESQDFSIIYALHKVQEDLPEVRDDPGLTARKGHAAQILYDFYVWEAECYVLRKALNKLTKMPPIFLPLKS